MQLAALVAPVVLLMPPIMASASPAVLGETTRVSVDSAGLQANNASTQPSISADGRYVAFESTASNLVPGDTNGSKGIFVHDRVSGETTRVSVDSFGLEGWSESGQPSISADGRHVAFNSHANNLVPGDTNNARDIFVHDRETGETTRVSVDSAGLQANTQSFAPSISADGRYVAFGSIASNLVPGDTSGYFDVFVHDRETGETTRVSVDSDGLEANNHSDVPSISADGRHVAFASLASNLVPGDTNGHRDVFVHDRVTGETTRVSVDSAGLQANNQSFRPSINADGRYVAFGSIASNLVPGDTNGHEDIFVHDRETGETTRVSVDSVGLQANGNSTVSSISADGRYVAFESAASNLVPGDTNGRQDIFVHDRVTGETTRVSVDSAGLQANNASTQPSISADGRHVAFGSAANLVPGDTNRSTDIFVHDRFPSQEPVLVSDVTAAPNPVAVQGMLDLTATATGGANILSATWTLNGMSGAMEPADGLFDKSSEDLYASLTAPYEAGVYGLCVNATDVAGATSDDACVSLVVYDPSSGFVTGSGWIWSPPGALAADASVMGRANFGFVSRYRRGANVPDGRTRFTFRAGDLNFHSDSYEWLVVTGSNHARFKGAGTVNRANAVTGDAYQFMIWAGDGDPDTFRIKIWYEDDGEEVAVYDNGSNQPIGGGRIVINTQ